MVGKNYITDNAKRINQHEVNALLVVYGLLFRLKMFIDIVCMRNNKAVVASPIFSTAQLVRPKIRNYEGNAPHISALPTKPFLLVCIAQVFIPFKSDISDILVRDAASMNFREN
jgi:hypothetical protein